jgi:hypothetical protein
MTVLKCKTVQTMEGDGKGHPTFYSEARYGSGRFAHQTRNRRSFHLAESEMNNWCIKNGHTPVWRN